MCECFVMEICQLYANNECTGDCSIRSYYDRILKQSQLPRKLQRVDKIRLIPDDVDLEAFRKLARIRDDIVNFVEQGKDLYIYSADAGTGKTTWAAKLLVEYFKSMDCRHNPGAYVNVTDLCSRYKNRFLNEEKDPELLDFIQLLKEADVVIWDDMGAMDKYTASDKTLLFGILDSRINNGLSNIYTSNIHPSRLVDKVDVRLADRIVRLSIRVRFEGYSHRTNGEEEV